MIIDLAIVTAAVAAIAESADTTTSHDRQMRWGSRAVTWCRGRDSNPYELALTAPSKQRVYQFHHLGRGERDSTRRRRAGRPRTVTRSGRRS